MVPGVRLIILGKQGAGKGTQCVRLARHYVIPHISTGDMLRTAVRAGTENGRLAEAYMRAGELVPSDVMVGIVRERLSARDATQRGFVLDGFPRTASQAESLDEILSPDREIDLVIDLEVPTEVVLGRLSARRVCNACGSNYNTTDNRPRYDWSCDNCGGEVVQREDDTPESIERRLRLYEQETSPLIDRYDKVGKLVVVDGNGHPDDVTLRLVQVIDDRRSATSAPGVA